MQRLLAKLERKLGRFALPHLTEILVLSQIVVYCMNWASLKPDVPDAPRLVEKLELIPARVLQGEVWRVATFLIVPPLMNVFFAFFYFYLLYLMGTALESHWGTFRYNLYLLVGYLATVAVSFLVPNEPSHNGYLYGTIFLAFAFLYPDFVIQIFFLLPVKIKWLALLTWLGYGFAFLTGDGLTRLTVAASCGNFLLFFAPDILERVRSGRRHMATQAKAIRYGAREPPYYHRCTVCGITDRTNPQMDFRYCSKCSGARCYCMEHLGSHEHVLTADEKTEGSLG